MSPSIQTGLSSPDQVSVRGGALGKFQIKTGLNTFGELLHSEQRYCTECFVVDSRIRGAGGSCLCFCCLRLFSTLSRSQRSLDGWRTRTPGRTTPACGSSAEAAASSGTVNPSWSSVSTDYSPDNRVKSANMRAKLCRFVYVAFSLFIFNL